MKKIINIMGGELYLYINSKDKLIENEIIEFTIERIQHYVNIFNFFDKKSSLSILNKYKEIDKIIELEFILKESLKFYKLTNKKFNPFNAYNITLIKNNKSNLIRL